MIDSINISKVVKSKTTGDNTSAAQAFAQNFFARINPSTPSVFTYKNPVYTVDGATLQYYAQTTAGQSSDVDNGKVYRINFTDNQESLSGVTTVVHDLHRITFDDYKMAQLDKNSSAYTHTLLQNLSTPLVSFLEVTSGVTGVQKQINGNQYTITFQIGRAHV